MPALAASLLLAAIPAQLTGSVGVSAGRMSWWAGADTDFAAHASLGWRVGDHAALVASGQLITAHVSNHSLDHVYEWQRWISSIGPGAQLDLDRLQLQLGGGFAMQQECVPIPLANAGCSSETRRGPALWSVISYRVLGPLRVEASASWFGFADYPFLSGKVWTVGAGVGAAF